MEFFAYCPYCEMKVGCFHIFIPVVTTTTLGGADLDRALDDADIEVLHSTADKGDHQWRLNGEEKVRLKKWLAARKKPLTKKGAEQGFVETQ
jgi:hypothetical protein